MQILEAFRALNALNEDVFSLDADGIKGLSDFKNNDDFEDDISIIDPEAETADDLQDNYIGKVILDCCVCHSKLYKAKEEVTIDENGELANVGEECPYCFTPDGFKVIGEVAAFEDKATEEDDEKEEIEEVLDFNVPVNVTANGNSVGFGGGIAGSTGLSEGIFGGNKYKGKTILVYKGNGEEEPIAISSDEAGNYNLIHFKQAHAKKNGNKESDYGNVHATDVAVKKYKKALKSIPDVSDSLPGWVDQYVKDAKKQRIADYERERNIEKAANDARAKEARNRYQSSAKDPDDDYIRVQGNGHGTFKHRTREGLEEGIFDKFKKEDDTKYVVWRTDEYGSRPHTSAIPKKDAERKVAECQKAADKAGKDVKYTCEPADKEKEIAAKNEYRKKVPADDSDLQEGIFDKFKKNKSAANGNSDIDRKKNHYYVMVEVDKHGNCTLIGSSKQKASDDHSFLSYMVRSDDCKREGTLKVMSVAEAEKAMRTDLSRLIKESVEMNESDDDYVYIQGNGYGTYRPRTREGLEDDLTESIDDLSITANDTHVEVGEDEAGKVTVTMEPVTADGGEMIAPVSDETEGELLGTEEEAPAEGEEPTEDEVDVDIDEVDEESVNELGESYFRRVYENVNRFKTTSVKQKGNSLVVEGMIKFNNGKVRKTSFMFEALDATKGGRVRFVGDNKHLTEGKKAFMLTGKMKGNKLIAESLNYNYKHKDASGKVSRVYGTERTSRR